MTRHTDAASIRWLQGFALCVVLMVPALWWSWSTQAPFGELTRIGRFSEADFGWRDIQPGIDPQGLRATPLDEADVLVIGDSFSMPMRWQSVLVAAGWRVATLHWRDIGGPLCADFAPWLRRQGFHGHAVVLQKVERSLPDLVNDSRNCLTMPPRRARLAPAVGVPALTHPPAFAYQWHAPLDTGIVTTWRTWRAAHEDASFVVHDAERVRVAKVPDGCRLFSHALCRRGLFLADDFDLPAVTPAHIAALPGLASSTQDLQIVWAITPNKSTIFLQPKRAAALSAEMRRVVVAPGGGVDLFGTLLAERDRQRDLYFPNDTHLSNAGYLVMGQVIAQALGPAPAH